VTTEATWIAEAWAEELKNVLQFLTADEWNARVTGDTGESGSNSYWWTQKFNAAEGATLSIGAPALAWSELGARILQAAGVDLIEQSSAKSTYLEAVQQSTSGLARAIAARLAKNVDASGGRDEAPEGDGITLAVVVSAGDFQLPALRVIVSEELCFALQPPSIAPPKMNRQAEPPAEAPAAPSSRTMSVLLDVQMPVSISFGKSSMPLREVMKLTTGSAVELDRKPDDEVDVIVNNCVIARGEVVVIDGNYGVRITEIVSREQRLALRAGARAC
jgi:flagellar motor switch protein FliN/FliY